uniref:desmocollin-3-like n=1 Tax=Pristiophorus japonicus TaxID=55135 RepID=UPI00398E92D3
MPPCPRPGGRAVSGAARVELKPGSGTMAVRGRPSAFFLASLLLMLSRFGEACVTKHLVVIVPSHQIKADHVISTVDLAQCHKDTLQISTSDPDFAVKLDGSLYATRDLYITVGQRTFDIGLQDSESLQKWNINVRLLFQQQMIKRSVRQRRAAILRRQKRRWRLAPFTITENAVGPFPLYVQTIRSEFEQNYSILYEITGPGVDRPPLNLFRVVAATGEIYVSKPVDREEYPVFELTGIAKTKEGFYPERPLDLTIKVNDVNDNVPVFNETSFSAYIAERSSAGTSVMKLIATDRDEPRTLNTLLRYKILTQTPVSKYGQLFTVDEITGEIKTNSDKLDREDQDTYTLKVEVRDMDGRSYGLFSTGTVIVHVTDVNDYLPTFKVSKYTIDVTETESDIMVLRMPVEDKDMKDTNTSRAVFTITKGNDHGNFKMLTDPKTNDGLLYVVKALDAEATSSILLEVTVKNVDPLIGSSLAPRTALVTVNVMDVDEGPQFETGIKQFWTMENVPIGTVLGFYTAKDPESNAGHGIRYQKLTDLANWVSIDAQTGQITTVGVMDRESEYVKNNKFNVTVLAIEERTPARTGTGTVIVNLEDANDHTPIIHNNHLHICENGHQQFVNVSAEDLDVSPNSAPFTFSLSDTPPDIKTKWLISKHMGSFAHVKPVVKLAPGYYEVPIIVLDQQGHGSEQTLKITICECPNNLNCAGRLASGSAVLGGMGILVMLLSALLLLCLLLAAMALYCGGGQKPLRPSYPDTQYHQSIIVSNEEGGGQQDKDLAALDIPLSTKPNYATVDGQYAGQYGINQETNFEQGQYALSNRLDGVNGMATSEVIDSGAIYDRNTLYSHNSMTKGNMVIVDGSSLSRRNSHGLMDLLRSQVDQVYEEEEEELGERAIVTDYLQEYPLKGAESVNGSVGRCSNMRENAGADYLNNLGPQFDPFVNVSIKR